MAPRALIVLCGRSYSGKSTVAAHVARALPADLLSLDAINEERGFPAGADIAVEEWATTFRTALDRAGRILGAGRSVVVDDTGSPRFLRDEWRAHAAAKDAPFTLLYVDASEATVRARAESNRRDPRRHDVAPDVLDGHLAGFEPPAADEPHLVLRSDADDADVSAVIDSIRRSAGC